MTAAHDLLAKTAVLARGSLSWQCVCSALVLLGHASLQQAQQAQQQAPISLLALMSKPATWAIIVVNFINHFGYFI